MITSPDHWPLLPTKGYGCTLTLVLKNAENM